MSPADRIAVRVKGQIRMGDLASGIVIGIDNLNILKSNPDPCDPPDLQERKNGWTFCGLQVHTVYNKRDELAFIVPVP